MDLSFMLITYVAFIFVSVTEIVNNRSWDRGGRSHDEWRNGRKGRSIECGTVGKAGP
jgi:hypothetical protein